MTPIQQAIEKIKAHMTPDKYELYLYGLQLSIDYLQSLLPVEKEWAEKVYKDAWGHGYDDASPHIMNFSPTFEQYYSQFNDVK